VKPTSSATIITYFSPAEKVLETIDSGIESFTVGTESVTTIFHFLTIGVALKVFVEAVPALKSLEISVVAVVAPLSLPHIKKVLSAK